MSNISETGTTVAQRSRWRSFLRRLESLIELRWPVATYRMLNAFAFIGLGVMVERAAVATVVVSFISYGLVSLLIEYGLAETSADIERRVNAAAEQKTRRLTTDLESY